MKPFPDIDSLTRYQEHYNYRQSRARMAVENAFGRLKGMRRHGLGHLQHGRLKHGRHTVLALLFMF